MGIINSELRKLFTLKLPWLLVIITLLLAAAFSALTAWSYSTVPEGVEVPGMNDPLQTAESVYRAGLMPAYLAAFTGAAMLIGQEWGHNTWTATFLATPRRWTVLFGKMVASVVVGLLVGLSLLAGALAGGIPFMIANDMEVFPQSADLITMLASQVLACILWALLGMGLALLLKSTVATVLIGFAFSIIGEQVIFVLSMIWDWVGDAARFLPGSATGALTNSPNGPWDVLPMWAGGLVLAGYALLFVILGGLRRNSTDVT
ncbi:hypothetical protein [Kytococcus sedentarius]|uniref:hypothetical protein n=1 Tax=Kytococcus sedentarius TaxID=1276 RepID=UPI0035BC466A